MDRLHLIAEFLKSDAQAVDAGGSAGIEIRETPADLQERAVNGVEEMCGKGVVRQTGEKGAGLGKTSPDPA